MTRKGEGVMSNTATNSDYWYENRHQLEQGQVFITNDGSRVMLDRRVPGDGTDWYVADFYDGSWFYEDSVIHPGDLVEGVS